MAVKGKSKSKAAKTAGVGRDWLIALQKGTPKTLYVLCGEETFRRDAAVRILKEKLVTKGLEAFNYAELDGKTLELRTLEETVNRPPMMAERTLVLVTDFPLFRKKRAKKSDDAEENAEDAEAVREEASEQSADAMLRLLSDLPPYVCLVFVYDTLECKPDARTKLYQKVKEIGEIAEFTPAPQEELEPWIRSRCKELGVRIEREEMRTLVEHCGSSMQVLAGEIDKLCLYTNDGRITREDILEAACGSVEGQIFRLCDAIALHRSHDALRYLREMEQAREEPIPLLSMLSRQMRNLYTARLGLDNGLGATEIGALCGFKLSFQTDNLIRQARGVKLPAARRAMLLCTEYDWPLKSSKTEGYDLLNDLVLALCRTLNGGNAA